MADAMHSGAVVEDVARFETMAHQVGGHSTAKTSESTASFCFDDARSELTASLLCVCSAGLKAHNGKVLKPFQDQRRGQREFEFYERVFQADGVFERLRPLIPGYHGMVEISDGADEHRNGSTSLLLATCLHG